MPTEPGWIPTEADFLNLLQPADWSRYFAGESIDAILAEHVWEHLDRRRGSTAAETCLRFLKPGGRLRLAVPDGNHPDPGYIDAVRPGGTGAGADDHKVLYTLDTLAPLLTDAGFEVEPLEYFDSEGRFHERPWDPADGLVRRSRRFDPRNRTGLNYTSLIVDARKPSPA